MKKPHAAELQLVAALAKHLLSPSSRFENTLEQNRSAMQDGLRCLASLDKATHLSLPIIQNLPPTPHPAPAAPAAPAQHFKSSRPEYQSALRSPEVIEALLKYQGDHGNPLAATFRQSAAPNVKATQKPSIRSRIFRSRETL
jgi:hypothetical protein